MEDAGTERTKSVSTQTDAERKGPGITSKEIESLVNSAALKDDMVSILSMEVPAGKTITSAALLFAVSLALGRKVISSENLNCDLN